MKKIDPTAALTIAVPKGRVLKQLIPRFQASGLDVSNLLNDDRTLVRYAADGTRYLLLKPGDVPTYVEYGAADVGVAGRDVLLESDYDLYSPVDLGIGRCRMMVCGLPDTLLKAPGERALRVASKYPKTATSYFANLGVPANVIYMNGSVELAPLTGLADVIVDLVETGETLRQNGLVPLAPICDISSVLVVNRAGMKLKRDAIAPLIARMGG